MGTFGGCLTSTNMKNLYEAVYQGLWTRVGVLNKQFFDFGKDNMTKDTKPVHHAAHAVHITAELLASILGKMNATVEDVVPAPVFFRASQSDLIHSVLQNVNVSCPISSKFHQQKSIFLFKIP